MVLSAITILGLQAIPAQAQEEQSRANPVEFFACNYMKGKDMKDLEKVADAFSAWSSANNDNYSAWILTPQFHDELLTFDVGWLGAWTNGNAFGEGLDAWQAEGGKLAADIAKVVDCSISHELASSVEISAPEGVPGDGVVMFAECTLNEGRGRNESFEAHKVMTGAMHSMGSKARTWLFYPGLGAGNVDFHYWQVISTNSYAELGTVLENYTNGGGFQKAQALLAPIVSCASPTVFDVQQVVAASQS
jgi:hypothetical protein